MTDLKIIKLLEEEITQHLKNIGEKEPCNIEYKTDENNNVVYLDIDRNALKEIPDNVLRLKHLKSLNISSNNIKKITPLLQLEKLEDLHIEEIDFDEKDFSEFLTNAKKLKLLNHFIGGFWDIMPKNILNHNLLLNTRYSPRKGFETHFNLDGYRFFPSWQMLELGYRNPKFYYRIYSHIENKFFKQYWKIKERYKNPEKELKKLKQEMISEILQIYYSDYQKTENLPYAIRKLSIYDFHEIKELLLDNIASNSELNKLNDPKWIFITGENGYGKTLILQSIVIGLFGDKDENSLLKQKGDFYLEFKNKDKYIINAIGSGENYSPFQNFAAYGPARLIKNPRYINESKTASLFNPYSELLDIENKLEKWKNDKQEHYLESAKKILEQLLKPQIEKIVVKQEGVETYVRYVEQNSKIEKKFNELASGYRSIITMIGDIIIRLSKHQQEISDFTQLAGIVIIDEIDLHLHPKWQKAMVEKITELFPKIQFIASTHSPIPILGAPENTVIINVQRTKEKGITAEKLNIDFSRLMPNSLLSSPIFDFEELIAKSKSNNKFPHTEDKHKDITEKEKLQNELSEFLTDEKTNELLNLIKSDKNETN